MMQDGTNWARAAGAALVVLAGGALAFLTGCDSSRGKAAAGRLAKSTVKSTVKGEAGAAPEYRGVARPTLTAVYTQSPEEAAKYGPIMQGIRENGLDKERKLQSGL